MSIVSKLGEQLKSAGQNAPEVLAVLKKLAEVEEKHFTVSILKSTGIGKVVGKCKNHEADEVKTAARALIAKWKNLARQQGVTSAKAPIITSTNNINNVLGKRKVMSIEIPDETLFRKTPRSIHMGGACTFVSERWDEPVMKLSEEDGPTRVLWWCRSDVRILDNTALHRASKDASKDAAGGVVALFVVSPAEWKTYDWGLCRVSLLMRSVRELFNPLRELDIPFIVAEAGTEQEVGQTVLKTAQDCGCKAVYVNRQYEVYESRRDKKIQALLKDHDIKFSAFHDECVVPPIEGLVVSEKTASPYKVYTPFKKRWWKIVQKKPSKYLNVYPVPEKQVAPLTGVKGAVIDVEAIPIDFSSQFEGQSYAELYPAGAEVACRALQQWVAKKVRDYSKSRDQPSLLGTSKLSHFLACGALSARQCVQAAVKENHGKVDSGSEGIVIWIQELIWRDFYRHVMVNWPHVVRNQSFKAEYNGIAWRNDKAEFKKWCEGKTGYPIVDAAMRQVRETGWMHNRARMIVANFLVKDLLIDWRWGEKFFMQNLIDCDVASNSGGWQWSAGCGTDAQPYFRIFNPDSQTEKFDPQCSYIKKYVPELRDLTTQKILKIDRQVAAKCKYPVKMCDHKTRRNEALAAFKAKLSKDKV